MVENKHFTVPQSVVNMYQLEEHTRLMVGKSIVPIKALIALPRTDKAIR